MNQTLSLFDIFWRQHVCCLVDNLLGKMNMMYEITWEIKVIRLKAENYSANSQPPFGSSPFQDRDKKTKDRI